jgi:hypothetical protein
MTKIIINNNSFIISDTDWVVPRLKEIKEFFLFFGFLKPPLSDKKIIKYIFRGLSNEQIYNVGCEYNNGFHKYRKGD